MTDTNAHAMLLQNLKNKSYLYTLLHIREPETKKRVHGYTWENDRTRE